MTREQAEAIYAQGPEAVVFVFLELVAPDHPDVVKYYGQVKETLATTVFKGHAVEVRLCDQHFNVKTSLK